MIWDWQKNLQNLNDYQRSIRSQTVLTTSTGLSALSRAADDFPWLEEESQFLILFQPLRLCHFTRVRVWTVYNPNRSMLGLVLANALDLAYKGLDFERRNILLMQLVYTELCKFCPRL